MTRANAIAAPRRKCTRSTRSPSGECRGDRTVNAPRSYALSSSSSSSFHPTTSPSSPHTGGRESAPTSSASASSPYSGSGWGSSASLASPLATPRGEELHLYRTSASSFTTTIVRRAGDRPHRETHAMLPRSLSLPSSFPPSLHAGSCTPTTSTARTATPAVQDLENAHDPDARARTISTARR